MSDCKRCGQAHPRCRAHNSRGLPCGKAPIKGARVCRSHGGAAGHVKAKAAERIERERAEREVAGLVRKLGLEVEVDPGEALLRELYRTQAAVLYLGRVVTALTEHEGSDDPLRTSRGLIHRATHRSQFGEYVELSVDPLVKLWQDERQHLAKITVAIGRLGLAEQQLRIAEQQGAALLEVLYGVLRELGHDPEGDREAAVVTRHLQAVAG